MKKIIALIIATATAFSLCACGNTNEKAAQSSNTSNSNSTNTENSSLYTGLTNTKENPWWITNCEFPKEEKAETEISNKVFIEYFTGFPVNLEDLENDCEKFSFLVDGKSCYVDKIADIQFDIEPNSEGSFSLTYADNKLIDTADEYANFNKNCPSEIKLYNFSDETISSQKAIENNWYSFESCSQNIDGMDQEVLGLEVIYKDEFVKANIPNYDGEDEEMRYYGRYLYYADRANRLLDVFGRPTKVMKHKDTNFTVEDDDFHMPTYYLVYEKESFTFIIEMDEAVDSGRSVARDVLFRGYKYFTKAVWDENDLYFQYCVEVPMN